jgi:hypothetical protein
VAEEALYQGRRIRLGIPGKLLFVRATQAYLVQPLPGSTDLAADAHRVYYRFPWPDEDGTAPGAYAPPSRALTLRLPYRWRGLHCRHDDGVHHLKYQAWYGQALVPVLQCGWCQAHWCPVPADKTRPLLDAIGALADGDRRAVDWLAAVAGRITAGYTDPAAACPATVNTRGEER